MTSMDENGDRPPARAANPPRAHRLGPAAVVIPARAVAGFGRTGRTGVPDGTLPPPLAGERQDLTTAFGRLAVYVAGPDDGAPVQPPLLLVHSINAAGSSYEVGPIFERERQRRRVYAFDLPGYGLSDRPGLKYSPRIMTDAILAVVTAMRDRESAGPIDAMALSLSSEFLARAASEQPGVFRSIALVSPTGLDSRGPRLGPPGSTRGMPRLYNGLTVGLWRRKLFELLTSRVSIRYFLEKTWGSKGIDEGLLEYDYRTTHQPGAEHAPYSFISGFLFSDDITRIYDGLRLPVWLVHGVRGDFVDYRGKSLVDGRPNWTIDILQTGALPQFERLDDFEARYDRFREQLG